MYIKATEVSLFSVMPALIKFHSRRNVLALHSHSEEVTESVHAIRNKVYIYYKGKGLYHNQLGHWHKRVAQTLLSLDT